MAEIRSINGGKIAAPGQPDPEVVKILRHWLQAAEAGDIDGVAIIVGHPNQTSSWWHGGMLSRSMVGSLVTVTRKVSSTVDP